MIEEPFFKSLPTSEDFYYDGELDEKWTREHYLGKDIDFAKKRYVKYASLSVLQDLSFVGTKAFRYYIFGAFRYLQDEDSKDDSDVFCSVAEMLYEKFEADPKDMQYISDYVVIFSNWAIQNYSKFDLDDYENIYGDVKEKYKYLIKRIEELY